MAKLPALVSALAEVDGREQKTIEHTARVIREAGYIPTTKRGSGAAEMTSREAVNLLLALNGADAPIDAPLAIDRFRSLELYDCVGGEKSDALEALRAISAVKTFGEALEVLIDGMPEIVIGVSNFLDAASETEQGANACKKLLFSSSWENPVSFKVTLERYSSRIELKTWVGSSHVDAHWRTEFNALFTMDMDRARRGFYGRGDGDRKVAVTITGLTLLKLWMALNPDQEKTVLVAETGKGKA